MFSSAASTGNCVVQGAVFREGYVMVRMIVFSVIAFGVAYLLYVFPVLALLSLFSGSDIFSLWSLLPAALVFMLIRLYLATSITLSLIHI